MDHSAKEDVLKDLRDLAYYQRFSMFENLGNNLRLLEENLQKHHLNVVWAVDEVSLCHCLSDVMDKHSENRVCFDSDFVPESYIKNNPVIRNVSPEDIFSGEQSCSFLVMDADYAVVESGLLAFLNRPLTASFNSIRQLVVIVPVDRVILRDADLSLFSYLGRKEEGFPDEVTIVEDNFDTIESVEMCAAGEFPYRRFKVQVTVVMYQNHIKDILADKLLRSSLYCIHCGRCAEVCPSVKMGAILSPIDLVKSNYLGDNLRSGQLFQQTTLCGNCSEVCPVNINIPDLLAAEMKIIHENSWSRKTSKLSSILLDRGKMNRYNNFFLRWYFNRKFFGKNKVMYEYFSNQNTIFFNIAKQNEEQQDE